MSVSNILNSQFQIPSTLAGGGGPTPPPAGAITQIISVPNSNISIAQDTGPNAVISTSFLQTPVSAEFFCTDFGVDYISTSSNAVTLTYIDFANSTYISQSGSPLTPDFTYNPGQTTPSVIPPSITVNTPGVYNINYKVNLVNQNDGTTIPTQPQSYAYVRLQIAGNLLSSSSTVIPSQYNVVTVEGSYVYNFTSQTVTRLGFSTKNDTASSVALWAGDYELPDPYFNYIPVSALITFQKVG